MDAYMRKLQNDLVTLGTGIVILSIWTLVKAVLYCVVYWNDIVSSVSANDLGPLLAIIIAMLILEFVLHSYVGLTARSEGNGAKKSIVYLVFTVIIILLYAVMIITEFVSMFLTEGIILTDIITIVIDSTSLAFLLNMLVSSLRLRKLKKSITTKEEAAS